MKLITTTPDQLTDNQIIKINTTVAASFGHAEDVTSMLSDTVDHLNSAEELQLALVDNEPIALAMYTRCLWQSCR